MSYRRVLSGLRGALSARLAYPIAERVTGRDIRSKRRSFASEMALPFAERRQRSWTALVDLVRFAGAHVPYYRDLFARIRFDPERLTRDRRYLQDIPYLTKELIHHEGERLLRDDHANHRKHVSKTGGSTGISAQIVYDQDAADWSSAVTRFARSTIADGGTTDSTARSELHFATRFPDAFPLADRLREHVKCFAMNRTNIFFSSLDPDELKAMWRRIKVVRPYLVHAHPTTIFHLALFAEERGYADRLFEVFESSGELLESKQRETIARVFGCRVIDRYGLAEAGIVAYQTDGSDPALLVFDPFCWPEVAEIEDDDKLTHVDGTAGGELVITPLRNRMMPLIRYRTGDLATLGETARGFVLDQMIGRTHDVVEFAGRRMPTHCIQDILDRVGGIRRFQVEVTRSRPILRIVPEPNGDTETIRNRLAGWWGDDVELQFISLSELKLQGSRSKFRHLVTGSSATPVAAPAD
jgi:phenylacetate-CoA ligase